MKRLVFGEAGALGGPASRLVEKGKGVALPEPAARDPGV